MAIGIVKGTTSKARRTPTPHERLSEQERERRPQQALQNPGADREEQGVAKRDVERRVLKRRPEVLEPHELGDRVANRRVAHGQVQRENEGDPDQQPHVEDGGREKRVAEEIAAGDRGAPPGPHPGPLGHLDGDRRLGRRVPDHRPPRHGLASLVLVEDPAVLAGHPFHRVLDRRPAGDTSERVGDHERDEDLLGRRVRRLRDDRRTR